MTIPSLLMIACLFLLTGANFVIYPHQTICKKHAVKRANNDPRGPVEEKPLAGAGLGIQEEYMHELPVIRTMSFFVSRMPYKISGTVQLPVVHSELTTPPPKIA